MLPVLIAGARVVAGARVGAGAAHAGTAAKAEGQVAPISGQSASSADRGIRNTRIKTAVDRQAEHAEGRQLRTQLLRGARSSDVSKSKSNSAYGGDERNRSALNDIRELQKAHDTIREVFEKENEELEEGDEERLLVENVPEKPGFPYIIFGVALIKDSFDVLATLIVIGIPVAMLLSFLMSLVLFFWVLGKVSGGWYKKKMIKWALKRAVIACFAESIPFLNMLPVTTIFILMVHFRETKIVKLINGAMEKLHHEGIRV
jgi:hypothetical protein